MKRVAIIGTMGVPAKYGGFESLVENIIGDNAASDIQYTIFCSGPDYKEHKKRYKGARLKYSRFLRANGIDSILYDIFSMIRCIRGYDTLLILGVSGCIFLPVFRLFFHKRLVINIDGLEHRRAKWGKYTRWFLRKSEAMAVRYADVVVSDNKGIQDYVKETYHKGSELIAYGGDHVLKDLSEDEQSKILDKYKLHKNGYAITVCRIEPENNSQIILEAFAKTGKQLVFIGNWMHSEWSRKLKEKYASYNNILFLNSVYDLNILYALRNNCAEYIHGHSAGGTNPSLVEAMFFGKPILAFDVVYNKETTEGMAYYFKTVDDLIELLNRNNKDGSAMREIALKRYTWNHIAKQYESIY